MSRITSSGHVATSYYLKIHFLNISSLTTTTTIVVVKIKVSNVAKVCDSDCLNHKNFYYEVCQV